MFLDFIRPGEPVETASSIPSTASCAMSVSTPVRPAGRRPLSTAVTVSGVARQASNTPCEPGSQLSVDFLIVKPDTSIVAAVELDDASHDRQDRRAADTRKAQALKSAGIPLLRWSVGQMPEVPAIAAALGKGTQAA
jgi:hypothetical protein